MRIDYSLEICQAKKLVKSNLTFSLKGNFSSSGVQKWKDKTTNMLERSFTFKKSLGLKLKVTEK